MEKPENACAARGADGGAAKRMHAAGGHAEIDA
jgi:hypothetical protein